MPASYPDSPHRGLPIPFWVAVAAIVLSTILAIDLGRRQAHIVRPVHQLAEPMNVPQQ